VVDDEPGIRYMARRVLDDRFDVVEAASAEEALRILETEAFHIAIVDVRLPGISGLDLLAAMKNLSPGVDVIVMTGSAVDVDEALEGAIRRRAYFFLRKPFPLGILETLALRVTEKQELEERLDRYTRDLEQGLDSARIFQRKLLPPTPWTDPAVRVASTYHPSQQLGGDFFDYWPLPSGGIGFLVADVESHGPLAAMMTGIVKTQVRSLCIEIQDPAEVLAALDEELSRIALPSFLTALLVFDRPDEEELAWSGAGHPPGLLWVPEVPSRTPAPPGGRIHLLGSTGLPVNTGLPPWPRETQTIPRVRGSRLFLYTDGYPETVDSRDRPFDEEQADAGQRDPAPIVPASARTPSQIITPEVIAAPGSRPAISSQPTFPPPDRATPFQFGSPFGRSALHALAADSPETGLTLLESARERFAPGLLPADDRAAVLAWLL
jgi:sigma-B regulation protein RsbU (phosphoserine phosphatase)/two-component system sensor histidine kinase ChiS